MTPLVDSVCRAAQYQAMDSVQELVNDNISACVWKATRGKAWRFMLNVVIIPVRHQVKEPL